MKPFQEYQKEFVNYLRDPENQQRPSYAAKERIKVYEELLFNNVNGFVETAFPVLQSIIPTDDWKPLVRRFFIEHHCASPFFIEISKQFVDFLAASEQPLLSQFPYLIMLAHYEWLELSVSVRDETNGDPLQEMLDTKSLLTLANTAEPASYQFPVHKISAENAHDEASVTPMTQPVYLVIYRKHGVSEVNFLEVNAVTALACSYLQNRKVRFEELLEYLHQHLPQFALEQLQQHLEEMLHYLSSLNIVVELHE